MYHPIPSTTSAVAGLLLLGATPLLAENWPQWRGPHLDGTSQEKNLPLKWTAQENVTWKLPLPDRSGSTPIVWGDRIFLNVAEADDIQLWSVDRKDGSVRWKR